MKRVVAALLALALVAAAGRLTYLARAPVEVAPAVEVEVAPGQTPREVATILEARGVVRSGRVLVLLARLSGADRNFRHGVHRFEGRLSPNAVIEELLRSPRPTVRVTIPEGLTIDEIGALLEQQGLATAEDYRRAACSEDFAAAAGAAPEAHCAEGYLFPDTYRLAPGMSAAEIARVQLQRFRQVISELLERLTPTAGNALLADFRDRAGERPWLTDAEARARIVQKAVTLASIIEKETSRASERPLIASVFHNRLLRGMRLQADPTVIYGLAVAGTPWDGKHLSRYLRKPGPYNTYTNDGLPPGPIANPGRGALEAALFPASTKYLYFVADGKGAHRFSETLAEHNKAVAQLRRR
ncbi:MAG: endolytic transglycosylase MltG [Deltaproteobacteria bacterium]|nr:MAG: endolytic transglycosylase MltG [Deltaproteobacteria bacterium]